MDPDPDEEDMDVYYVILDNEIDHACNMVLRTPT